MNLYDKVKALADEQGKTIAKVETEAGIANGTIGGWRTSKPYAETLQRVSKVLGVDIKFFLEEKQVGV